ncbi:hypothetical protein F3Y22_tig00117016pilonHSYRG00040 [Hibiscus syriacus]|uniref:Uncharacterized protein n=1 Tax=Hibiscus syriacus TaxID=106335 RepID=A0A6A2WIK7_HIBSY|nr:hypothetical protein F3Y22_tig00117016pilonHSYRG00040 [Hibiscus syriacus]
MRSAKSVSACSPREKKVAKTFEILMYLWELNHGTEARSDVPDKTGVDGEQFDVIFVSAVEEDWTAVMKGRRKETVGHAILGGGGEGEVWRMLSTSQLFSVLVSEVNSQYKGRVTRVAP